MKQLRSRESNPAAQAYETRWDVRSHSASRLCPRQDSNLRPPGSEPGALLQLSYGGGKTERLRQDLNLRPPGS